MNFLIDKFILNPKKQEHVQFSLVICHGLGTALAKGEKSYSETVLCNFFTAVIILYHNKQECLSLSVTSTIQHLQARLERTQEEPLLILYHEIFW
jgi:hypothetical protein